MVDEYMFQDEQWPAQSEASAASSIKNAPWKILVADDEQDIHEVTLLVLKNFTIKQRPLQIISAYNEQQAKQQLKQHPDIAVAIIDMIMDCEQSGILLCEYIREELCNQECRIVLRSGQSGQLIDIKDIERYDISDYKQKTELTTARLKSLCYFMISAYQQTRQISDNRAGIEHLITLSSDLLQSHVFKQFAKTLCQQLLVNLQLECENYLLHAVEQDQILFASTAWASGLEQLTVEQKKLYEQSLLSQTHHYQQGLFASFSHSFRGNNYIFLLQFNNQPNLNETEKQLLIEFNNHLSLAIEQFISH